MIHGVRVRGGAALAWCSKARGSIIVLAKDGRP
jgi:hypothetical protein